MSTVNAMLTGEKLLSALQDLYQRRGYIQYRMSRFEDYDLYAGNKDFLVSEQVITFTDRDGRLKALKPDVTLSIVRHSRDLEQGVRKLFYHENVYRGSRGSGSFSEIPQAGLECLGQIDGYCVAEAVTLAAASLRLISAESLLEVSHMGIVSFFVDRLGVGREERAQVLKYIGEKNTHDLALLCARAGVPEDRARSLTALLTLCGTAAEILERLDALACPAAFTNELRTLDRVLAREGLDRMVRIDFSVVCDTNYYNGIVFKGYVSGVPASVLSGGRYDLLLQKMHRKAGAIGFAVYLDELERLQPPAAGPDADVLLRYPPDADPADIADAVRALIAQGRTVLAAQEKPAGLRFGQTAELIGNEVRFSDEIA